MEPLNFGDDRDTDRKYVVFKREDWDRLEADPSTRDGGEFLWPHRIRDAVVIRRQDFFASPALASYAASIAIAAQIAPEKDRKRLLQIADYFEDQAKLAADEGWKLPD